MKPVLATPGRVFYFKSDIGLVVSVLKNKMKVTLEWIKTCLNTTPIALRKF
jgi:hypothetical protein